MEPKCRKEAKLGHSSSLLKKIAHTIPSHNHFYAVRQRKGKKYAQYENVCDLCFSSSRL